jgi:hypothetical protein
VELGQCDPLDRVLASYEPEFLRAAFGAAVRLAEMIGQYRAASSTTATTFLMDYFLLLVISHQ